MTLIVETPDTRAPERDYILGVLLGEFLGLDWARKPSDRRDVRISLTDHPGKAITLPDRLLNVVDEEWLSAASMPKQPLAVWDTGDLGLNITLIEPTVPVIYGDAKPAANYNGNSMRLPVDLFGSAFFMLTRYEEVVIPHRDEHDRFPAWASLAYQDGFLERPIIDEYVEILWAAMKALWPELVRKEKQFEVKVSHDVDHTSRYAYCSPKQLLRRMAGDGLIRKRWADVLRAPWIWATTNKTLHPLDPYNTFNWLMDFSDRHGLTSAFYFMVGVTDPAKDGNYDFDHPSTRQLMRKIHQRGHEIGLHASYNTYLDQQALIAEADKLRSAMVEEGIKQTGIGGRMHYLRWAQPVTLRSWAQSGMSYDSTLGYADRPGFRCGTCRDYSAYDPVAGDRLDLQIRPLIAMECSVLSPQYLGLGTTDDATAVFHKLMSRCKTVRGAFTLLWHNSELLSLRQKQLYSGVVSGAKYIYR